MAFRITTLAEAEAALELLVQTPQQTRVATVETELLTLLLEALSPTVAVVAVVGNLQALTHLERAEPEVAETVLQELGLLVEMGLMALEGAEAVQGELLEQQVRMPVTAVLGL
jgi:hypothetical protein